MSTQILPAASLRSGHRLPAALLRFRAANCLIRRTLWAIARAIFGVEPNFLPALRDGTLPGGVEEGADDPGSRPHRRRNRRTRRRVGSRDLGLVGEGRQCWSRHDLLLDPLDLRLAQRLGFEQRRGGAVEQGAVAPQDRGGLL